MRISPAPSGGGRLVLTWRLASLGVALILALVGIAATAQARTLTGTLAPGVGFPNRTVLLSVPQTVPVNGGSVHVTENGRRVGVSRVSQLAQGQSGELGVVLVIDSDPSMAGAPLAEAMAAARTLAGERTGSQEIGAVFGDGTSLPLTSDQATIHSFLSHAPRIVNRTNLLGATGTAIAELKAAAVLSGAVIYVSDDIDKAPGLTPERLAATAAAAHVRIFSVAISDFATTHPGAADLPLRAMRTLAHDAGGSFNEASPAHLRSVFVQIEAGLTSQYVVSYRSAQRYGRPVRLVASVDGVAGRFSTTYDAPPPPAIPAAPTSHRSHGHATFWATSLAVAVVAIVAAALMGVAIALVLSHYARSGELRSRVRAFVPESAALPALVRTGSPDPAVRWERVLEQRRWWPAFVARVDISSLQRDPTQLIYWAIAGSLVAAILLDVISGTPLVGVLGLAVGPLVLRAIINRSIRRQRLAFMEQLPGQLHEVASAMRTGRSLVEALGVVVTNADEPMRRELERALADERAGLHIEDALRPIGERMESSEIEQVTVVASLHRRTGANITEVLDRVADTARQRVEIRRELLALTAQARLSRNVLTALPVVVVIAIALIGKGYEHPLFHTRVGILVLIAAGLMVAVGGRVMKTIVDIEE